LRQAAWENAKRLTTLVLMGGLVFLSASRCDAQILHKKKKVNKSTSADNTAEPDKVLYDKAMDDIKHGRQEVGRLSMQTLINTYPDSEYLAKAKLAIADSYFKEGGSANTTQAIQAYKDFGIFFPFLPEAAYAQLQVANAHYNQINKPDRDRTEAKAAEDEYQTFLEKYPKDPLAPKAEQRLRNVQEIIAEGDYRIGYFYYVKGDKRAAAARLIAVTRRYPLYSKSDKALWMLGDVFEKSEHREIASLYYAQIVKNYPLSPLVPDAKSKLKEFKTPVPQPDPKALAWMTAEQNAPRQHDSLIKKPLALVRSGPHAEMLTAAKTGEPNLQPDVDNASATDVLSGGNRSQLGAGGTGGAATGAVVEVVTPGTTGTTGTVAAPASTSETGGAATGSDTSGPVPSTTEANPNPATGSAAAGQPATGSDAPNSAATPAAATPAAATPAAGGTANGGGTPNANGDSTGTTATNGQNTDGTKTDSSQNSGQNNGDNSDQKESSSKKKKGLHKILPW
jgi:outer membrane protein assembly factor BamD